MATNTLISEMVGLLASMTVRTVTTDEKENLARAYYHSFKNVGDKALRDAVYRYMDEETYYPPKPPEIRKYIKTKIDKHTQELIDRFTCPTCHKKVSLMIEGKCEECQ